MSIESVDLGGSVIPHVSASAAQKHDQAVSKDLEAEGVSQTVR